MEYAIVLYFDSSTEKAFNIIINDLFYKEIGGCQPEERLPPHLTVACFTTDSVETVLDELDKNILRITSGQIVWASLGAFVPKVLFASPVMSEYLININQDVHNIIEPYSVAGANGHYTPGRWVPHTTLLNHLDKEMLVSAFEAAAQQFSFISGRSSKLIVAECNPLKVIRTWDLQ